MRIRNMALPIVAIVLFAGCPTQDASPPSDSGNPSDTGSSDGEAPDTASPDSSGADAADTGMPTCKFNDPNTTFNHCVFAP